MNSIENSLSAKLRELKEKKQAALVSFFPLGFPNMNTSIDVCAQLLCGGTDILEVGIPFSDPIADGPTIQAASQQALANGANPKKCFEAVRKLNASVPVMILTYYNLLYKMGVENFVSEAKKAGVSAILAADLPIEEASEFEKACAKHNVATVFIIAPNTSSERVKKIALHTTGFLYLMAHFGVTGEKDNVEDLTIQAVKRVKKATNTPVCVGFGISKEEHARKLAEAGADGVIVGSAFVKASRAGESIEALARKLKHATLKK
ncbi:tryptophan synthase subunit alpha [Candidatus Micrarchaeota archaeon]|nr:tryptophan synthase subunit alpha [Candidatus Micrarchaeota archaeon]